MVILRTTWHRPGYIGSLSVLQTIRRVVETVRTVNPNAVYGACFVHRCFDTWWNPVHSVRPCDGR